MSHIRVTTTANRRRVLILGGTSLHPLGPDPPDDLKRRVGSTWLSEIARPAPESERTRTNMITTPHQRRFIGVFHHVAILVLGCLALGCNNSSLVSQWRDPSLTRGPYSKVLVLSIGPSQDMRRTYEDAFARELRQRGLAAIESYTLPPLSTNDFDRDTVVKVVADLDVDAVIVTRLLDMESRAVAGSQGYTLHTTSLYSYRGAGSYYRSAGYGGSGLQAYQSTVATLETSLFDAASALIVWTGTTETFDADEAQQQIPDLVKTLITAMVAARLIT